MSSLARGSGPDGAGRDLSRQLGAWAAAHSCLVGLGNVDLADDGAGVHLARAVAARAGPARRGRILEAGVAPERWLSALAGGGFTDVIFLDAVDFGARPGAVLLAGGAELAARFPQSSTHRLGLGLLGRWVERAGGARPWLLGVQPGSLTAGAPLTPAVRATVEELAALLAGDGPAPRAEEAPP